ncbi:MAG: VTT domain-containing protein [Acidimicrobiia bacterium]|nr:VTT domain-containing protein [Acidimicrobiia bacterium]
MIPLLAALGFLDFLDPERIIRAGGLVLLGIIVFAESGLLVGFFLPGDSLLFVAGFLSAEAGGQVLPALPWVLLVAFVAAVAGDQVGYLFGRKVGPALFDRPDSRFFKQANVDKAHAFMDKHGPKTIVLARFVPIVRTFAPIVAGVGAMDYRTFVTYNVVGGLLWAVGVTTLGYFLGEIEIVKDNIEIAIIVIVAVSLLPVVIELWRHRRAAGRRSAVDS